MTKITDDLVGGNPEPPCAEEGTPMPRDPPQRAPKQAPRVRRPSFKQRLESVAQVQREYQIARVTVIVSDGTIFELFSGDSGDTPNPPSRGAGNDFDSKPPRKAKPQ